MTFLRSIAARAGIFLLCFAAAVPAMAKVHSVALGAPRKVPYTAPTLSTRTEGAAPGTLRVRPLVVDGRVLEWTAGEVHEITDRSFVVRRAVRLNDALPGEKGARWMWALGPWLLVDRMTARITTIRLPDFDPAISEVTWFRDYAAYCGINSTGKHLYAVVAQLGVRRPLVAKALGKWTADDHPTPVCADPTWQRQPLQVTFHPTDADTVSFQLLGLTSALVEEDRPSDEEQ